MIKENFTFKTHDGIDIFVYRWKPEANVKIKGIVQITHGMAETAARYERFADKLTREGYIVYADDQRGHGKTAKKVENLGYFGEDGFNSAVKDMLRLNVLAKQENPGLPLFLYGHSMGSLLSQSYIYKHGDTIDGVVLSGTSGKQGITLKIGIMIAKKEVKKHGPKALSPKLNNLSFGGFNKAFKPCRTEFDWLSRDEKEVDKYIRDPFCGTVFTTSFFRDLALGIQDMHRNENMALIPKTLPIYLLAGEKDPVGKKCKTIKKLIDTYKAMGIKDVTFKFYEDGRHEMLNEVNRDEVMQDSINWLNNHIKI